MKKLLLPIAVVAASGAYVWLQQSQMPPESDFAVAATETALPQTEPSVAVAPVVRTQPSTEPVQMALPAAVQRQDDDDEGEDEVPLPVRRPAPTLPAGIVRAAVSTSIAKPAPAAVAAHVAANGSFVDGTYTGPAANAYYGLVQVAAVIQGSRLTDVQILQYPSDRRTSRYINSQALPLLIREAIRAQSGKVNFISGATLTSNAFAKSLSSALSKAG